MEVYHGSSTFVIEYLQRERAFEIRHHNHFYFFKLNVKISCFAYVNIHSSSFHRNCEVILLDLKMISVLGPMR